LKIPTQGGNRDAYSPHFLGVISQDRTELSMSSAWRVNHNH